MYDIVHVCVLTNTINVYFQDVHADVNNADGTDAPDTPALPVTTDPKKAKAEQKRLEKEEKERERKRVQEQKRILKEQEKQAKENARKDKSGAPTRRQERDNTKQKSGIASFMSPARQGVRPKNSVRGRVMLLDGSEIEVEIEVSTFLLVPVNSYVITR